MHAALAPDAERLIATSLERIPVSSRLKALEVGTQAEVSPALGCRFGSTQIAAATALYDLPSNEFNFLCATRAFPETAYPEAIVIALREASRLLAEHGILCAQFGQQLSLADLVDHARDLDFQILALYTGTQTSLLWRKRGPGWRVALAEHAAFASTRIVRIASAWDDSPLVPERGRFAAVAITVEALPLDLDLLDLEVRAANLRSTALSLSEPDARGRQRIVALLPSMERTGLIPIDLYWFGERISPEPAYIRVIPPGPLVPRIASVAPGASRLTGITISIDELARPDELSASIGDVPIFGLESRCTDSGAQRYEVRLFLPEQVPAGTHQIQLLAGHRKLAPIAIEID